MIRTSLEQPSTAPFDFLSTLARARAGDAAAREALFRRFYPRVEGVVHVGLERDMRRGRPWLTARFSTGDVVQEVFRSVLEDLGGFHGDGEDAFVGYLVLVVRNRILDAVRFHEAVRRDGRRTGELAGAAERAAAAPDPAEAAGTAEEVARLRAALDELPPREQLLVRARLEEAQSFAALADSLGYPSVSTARRAFYAVQARLALRLGRA